MKFKPLVLAAAAASLFNVAQAAEGGPEIKVSGFGTVAAAISDDGDLVFRKTLNNGTGVENKIDLGSESRLGLQGDVRFQHGLSMTAQVVAMRRLTGGTGAAPVDKDFDPGVEWLFAQYQINDQFNARLGRMQLPAFLLSDSLNVGYAAPWMRAPVHVYASEPFSRLDGAQVNWRQSFGSLNLGAQVSYGRTSTMIVLSTVGERKADWVGGLNFTVESGDWLGRAGLVKMKFPSPSPGLDALEDTYASLGLQYDDGRLLVMSEFAKRTQNDQALIGGRPIVEGEYAYVSAGWRFGKLLPMVTWSRGDNTTFLGTSFAEDKANAFGASLRYDLAPNVALKAQIDRYKGKDGSVFTSRATDDRNVHVFTAGVDFVF